MVPVTYFLLAAVACGQPLAPTDWDAAVIDACESAVDFAPGDAGAYADCKLTTTDTVKHQGRSIVWTFAAGEGAQSVALSHAAGPLGGRGAIGLWLKNPEGHALRLGVRLTGSDGNVFDSERMPINDARAWRELLFLTDDLRSAAGAEAALEFPLRRFEIVLEGAVAGGKRTLYVDDLTAYVAPPEEVEIVAISAPEAVPGGGEIVARVRLRAPSALKRPYRFTLAVESGGVAVAEAEAPFAERCTAWPAGSEIESGPVKLPVPAFLAGGEYTLRLKAPGLALSGEAARGVPVRIEGVTAEPTTVQVIEHNGVPTAMIGETPLSLWGRFWRGTSGADAQTSLLIIPATATHDPYGWAPDVWTSRDVWDYEALDRTVIGALRAQPEARIMLRVFLEAPDWWDAQNPNELILFSHGRHAAVMTGIAGKQTYASFASKKWREDAREALRRFVAHVEQAPYADRVIGTMPAGGEDGRWRYWGATEGLYADYSRPQRTAFIGWLRQKHNNDIRALRAKWQEIVNPIVAPAGDEERIETLLSWDDIQIPDIAARTAHPSGVLLDPAAAPEVADYNLFHAEQLADFICDLAATAKEACERRKLVGVSYGHFLDHARSAEALPNAGHLALDRVLASTDVDLVAAPCVSPTGSAERGLRVWSSAAGSVKGHGKIPIDEILPMDAEARPDAEAAQMAAMGGAVWFGGAGPEDAPAGAAPPDGDRASVAEIALIVDHYSLAYLAEGNVLSEPLLAGQCASLAQVGAPYDVWLLDDLIAGRVPDYKLYVMADAFYLDEPARQALREQVARDGKTVLWIYAPGSMDETLSGRTAFELTDLAVGFVSKAAPLRVKVVDSTHPLIEGAPRGFEYGVAEPTGPVFFAMPTRGQVLGTIVVPSLLDKGEPREWAGLIASEGEDWTTIFSAAPNVPPELLRPMARRAGVHLYVDSGDQVWVNGSSLAVHALTAGDKRVRLPQAADVRDAQSGAPIATRATEFAVAMSASETRMFAVSAPGG